MCLNQKTRLSVSKNHRIMKEVANEIVNLATSISNKYFYFGVVQDVSNKRMVSNTNMGPFIRPM